MLAIMILTSSCSWRPKFSHHLLIVCALLAPFFRPHAADWHPAKAPLMTRWAKDVCPTNAHPAYPRPQMVRPDWLNLNGLWDFAVTAKVAPRPETFSQSILVPFPAE